MKKQWKITIKYDRMIFHSKLSGGVSLTCDDLYKSSPFGFWPLSLPGKTIHFILVAFRCCKNLKIALIYVCILNFRNKKGKALPSSFGLTDLSVCLMLYQTIALWWLDLKHPYFVLQPYCPLLTIEVAPKFHSGSSLIFVFPSAIHTETLADFWKLNFLFCNMVVRI